jgi:hypothetical protein
MLGYTATNIPSAKNYLNIFKSCHQLLQQASAAVNGDEHSEFLLYKLDLSLKYAELDYQIKIDGIQISTSSKCINKPAVCIEKLTRDYDEMASLFNNNLDKGIFIWRGQYYNNILQ